jgi:hypothetical protein
MAAKGVTKSTSRILIEEDDDARLFTVLMREFTGDEDSMWRLAGIVESSRAALKREIVRGGK